MSASTVPAPVDAQALAAQLDRVEAQLADVLAELAVERAARERRAELVHELTPVAQAAMGLASQELADLTRDVSVDDAVRFARTAVRALPALEALLLQAMSAGELVHEVNRIAGAGVASVSDALADAQRRGWFDAARRGAEVGGRMADAVRLDWPDAPPSTLALLRSLRDPRTRLGLARAVSLVRALGSEEPPAPPSAGSPAGAPHTREE